MNGRGVKIPFSGLGLYTVIYLTFIYLPVLFLPLFSFNDAIYVAFPLKDFTLRWYEQMTQSPGLLAAFQNSLKLGLYTVIYLTFIYLPVLFLPLFSFNDAIYVAFPLKDFTLRWYEQMTQSPGLLAAFQNSLKLGIVVAIVSTIFGTLAAKAFTRYRVPFRRPLKGFIAVPLVIPLIILGISLMVVFNRVGVPLSLFTIGLSHVVICVPFSMLVMISRLEGFDPELEEAAQDLGETPWMTFWRVTFPVALPGIVASLLLCFTISFDEFLLAFFLAGEEATLPVYIWSQLRFPNRLPSVLALGSCILLASCLLVLLAEWVRRLGAQPSKGGQEA